VARYRESLSKHYYNQATVLRQLDRPAEAAAMTVARRELWPRDRARLARIAEDLAAICQELPAGEVRQQYQHEVAQTRAKAAKTRSVPTAGSPQQVSVSNDSESQTIHLEIK
jgi:hypothetical protein